MVEINNLVSQIDESTFVNSFLGYCIENILNILKLARFLK